MYYISIILGKTIEKYVSSAIDGERECRLLVPGLTPTIAEQMHQYLLENLPPSVPSYLIIRENIHSGDTPAGEIEANSLTSLRIGSFVIITSPGQLINVQDSIRGSGGPIRSVAFSEEWPWIDDVGSESFCFNGPVLSDIVEGLTSNKSEQEWLREFIINGLVENTRFFSQRSKLFLEDIIGSFQPTLYPEISDIREKLLFHAGIPRLLGTIPSVSNLIKKIGKICSDIIEQYVKDEDIRSLVKERIDENFPEEKRQEIRKSIDYLLDKIGDRDTVENGLLSFYNCWENPKNWLELDANRLADLFDVKQSSAEIEFEIHCPRGLVEHIGKNINVASFIGEIIEIDINYSNIPEDQLNSRSWNIRVLLREKDIIDPIILETVQGQIHTSIDTNRIDSYSKRIPLRVALAFNNEVRKYGRLYLHLCGSDRPAFVVVKNEFEVIDANKQKDGEDADETIIIEEPIDVFLFENELGAISLHDEKDRAISLIKMDMPGMWASSEKVNVSQERSGQVTWTFGFDNLFTVICFEGKDVEKGEFTIEDEYRIRLSDLKTKDERLNKIHSLFFKTKNDFYPILGGIDDAARQRIFVSGILSNPTGWHPIITNLLKNYQNSGSLGNFINFIGPVENEDFRRTNLPPDALSLLKEYSDARSDIFTEINSYSGPIDNESEHPLYATHPIFVKERSDEMENIICRYLKVYSRILDYIYNNQSFLNYYQKFILIYLDCVVDWDNSRDKAEFFLIGPWHPLIVSKRFMVQSSIFFRTERYLNGGEEGREFRQLSTLLARVQGFKWVITLLPSEHIKPAFVSTTSDPGWHVALKTDRSILEDSGTKLGLKGISDALEKNIGIFTETYVGGSQKIPITGLKSYMDSFPSRRSMGVRICRGYVDKDVIKEVDSFLHDEDKPKDQGYTLPGGVRLYFQEPLEEDIEAKWINPPLFVYEYKDDVECIQKTHPDIFLSQPSTDVSFITENYSYELPRGEGLQTIFAEPLRWLTNGPTHIPDSITYEFDNPGQISNGIGGMFMEVMREIRKIIPISSVRKSSIALPEKLNAPWVIIPGQSLDPAILVKYVNDSISKSINERALWDYSVSIDCQANSYFILSMIPRGFQVIVNNIFDQGDIAGQFIVELGKIGIAIGGEALKSGRRALGIVGLVGAVRLLTNDNERYSPIKNAEDSTGFLIPVDSFKSFFGKVRSGEGKRSDILAVQIFLPNDERKKMRISALGVESKFVSGTFSSERVNEALDQGRSTTIDFKNLVIASLKEGGMPERLAILELLKFGLRISSQYLRRDNEFWINLEKNIYLAVLRGNYEYFSPSHEALLISTEADLFGPSVYEPKSSGLWIRLTKTHWPGIVDQSQIENITQVLSALFDLENKPSSQLLTSTLTDQTTQTNPIIIEPQIITTNETNLIDDPEDSCEKIDTPECIQLEKIFIGVDDSRVPKYYDPQSPVDSLENLNMMVTGSSGMGKTQFLKYLICKFREQNKNLMILDFKNDFASDERFSEKALLERIFVDIDGLPYNPLIPFPIRHPATKELFFQPANHITGITSVFKKTYNFGDQQAAALVDAISSAFIDAGIEAEGNISYVDNFLFPDFSVVGDTMRRDNERAYNRFRALFSMGIFNPNYRQISFHELTGRSIILDFSRINSDEIKNALAQLVVMSAHAYFNSIPHSGAIRQFFVIDEAFRVLDYEYMNNFVLQCRAYGVGMILSSQYPSHFPRDLSSSLITKVIHGNLGESNRIKEIAQLIHCEGKEGDIANLGRFQAILNNKHHLRTFIRTMNYPLYLIWEKLQQLGKTTRDELTQVDGFNPSMLSIDDLILQLKRMGLADEKDEIVFVINRTE